MFFSVAKTSKTIVLGVPRNGFLVFLWGAIHSSSDEIFPLYFTSNTSVRQQTNSGKTNRHTTLNTVNYLRNYRVQKIRTLLELWLMWTIPKQSKRGTARDATTSGREFHWLSMVFPNNKTPLVRTRRARARACNTLCRTYWQTAEPLRATDPQRSINDRGLLESLDQSSRKRWGEWKDICCPLSSNRGLRYFINSVLSKYN